MFSLIRPLLRCIVCTVENFNVCIIGKGVLAAGFRCSQQPAACYQASPQGRDCCSNHLDLYKQLCTHTTMCHHMQHMHHMVHMYHLDGNQQICTKHTLHQVTVQVAPTLNVTYVSIHTITDLTSFKALTQIATG